MIGSTGNTFSVGQLVTALNLDTTQFRAAMAQANSSMMKANATMATVGRNMNRYLTLPILASGAAAVKMYSDFESSMSKIQGLVGVAADSVEEMSDQVLELSKTAGRGPSELADALFFITSAGQRGAEAMETLEMSARASVAGLGETKTIADLVTSAMNAYGAANLDAAEATDTLVAAVKEGKAEADALAGAMGMVLPIASEMGVTFDQVGATFAGMTRTGTNARVAATQLKAVLSKLLNPTRDAEDALDQMGLSAAGLREMIKEEGLISTLELLRQKTNQYGDEMMGKVFPNVRALMGVLDLMGKNMEENIAISERMADSTGALDAAYEAATQTVEFKWNQAISASQTALVEWGGILKEGVLPVLESVTRIAGNVADRLDEMTEAERKTTLQIVAITAATGPAITIMTRLFKLIMTNPYAVLLTALVAVIGATARFVKTNKMLFDSFDAVEDAEKAVTKETGRQTGEVRGLVAAIENENLANETRIKAINNLKKIIPEYTGHLTEEGKLIDHNTESINAYLEALKQKIRMTIYEEKYTEALRQQVRAEEELAEKEEILKKRMENNSPLMVGAALRVDRWRGQLENAKQAVADLDAEAQNLNITLGETPEPKTVEPDKKGRGTGGGGTGGGGTGGGGTGGGLPVLAEIENEVQESANLMDEIWSRFAEVQEQTDREIRERLYKSDKEQTEYLVKSAEREIKYTQTYIDESERRMAQYRKEAGIWAEYGDKMATIFGHLSRAVDKSNATLSDWFSWIGQTAMAIGRLISVIKTMVIAKKAEAMATGIQKGAEAGPFPENLIAIAAEVAAVAASFAQIPAFKAGGLIYGETIARTGEYPGARSNPEVIAPLDKLRQYMPQFREGRKEIKLRAEGRDLVTTIKLEDLIQNTY